MAQEGPEQEQVSSGVVSEIQAALDELEASYWIPALRTPFETLDEMAAATKDDCPALSLSVLAFRSNLAAAKELLEFPYDLLAPLLLRGSKFVQEVRAAADAGSDEEAATALLQGHRDLAVQAAATLISGSRQHLIGKPALTRLMHQACVLAWSAFETYCKEVFVAAVNQKPGLFAVIQKNQGLRERFSVAQANWPSLLERYDYDLKGKLGTIIAADKDFSSPQLVRDLFPALFADVGGSPEFLKFFQREELWTLGQRRHLIAHRCGIVDDEYLRKTKDQGQEVGKLLKLRGRDVAEGMGAVVSAAIALYGAARGCWRAGGAASEGA